MYAVWLAGATISHLLYLDGIKLYTKKKCDIVSLIHLTRIYSNAIRMSVRLGKGGHIVSRRGRMITAEGGGLPEDNTADVQNNYK